ncbi:MAG: hypothetical protein HYS09_00465 [Chloroflexi bacterium]|nr:hypothetical protein [Chloroflexota bacterium]
MTLRLRHLLAGVALILLVAAGLGFLLYSRASGGFTSAVTTVPPSFFHAVKFVCVPEVGPAAGAVVPGTYKTAINVHNPNPGPVDLAKKAVIARSEDLTRGPISTKKFLTLGSDRALEIDCADIKNVLFGGKTQAVGKGFVVIESPAELDVVAVYTQLTTVGSSEDKETVTAKQGAPTFEFDRFSASFATATVGFTGGQPDTVNLSGPTTVRVDLGKLSDTACGTTANNREEVPTELVQLSLTGSGPNIGPVTVTLRPPTKHPNKESVGCIEETTNSTPGVLDLPPFGTGTADSFFDVFFEVDVQNFGVKFHNHDAKHMTTTITNKPPAEGETYEGPDVIPLFTEDEQSSPWQVQQASHVPNPPPTSPTPSPTPVHEPTPITGIGGRWENLVTFPWE